MRSELNIGIRKTVRTVLGGILSTGILLASAPWASAQSTPSTATTSPDFGNGRVITVSPVESSSLNAGGPTVVRPARIEQQPVSSEVQAQLQKFQLARDAYLKKQQTLAQQLKGSSEEQRKLVRDQLKSLRDQWLEQSLEFRKQLAKDRPDILQDLRPFQALPSRKPGPRGKPLN